MSVDAGESTAVSDGFVHMLRSARKSRVAALHEFWTQYSPQGRRLHAFFEGHDDPIFFGPFIERYLPAGTRLFPYRCEGKSMVYQVFGEISRRLPHERSVLFFVDKDLDDVMGGPWPTDPRIFVTDVYSVENYLASGEVLAKFFRASVRSSRVSFDDSIVFSRFDSQLRRFHRAMLVPMAWIVATRRAGGKPRLGDVDLRELCAFNASIEIVPRRGRFDAITRATGVPKSAAPFVHVLRAARELARIPPKRIVRGKFELWFVVHYWKATIDHLRNVAKEGGGSITTSIALEQTNAFSALVPHLHIPRSLELFLQAHFPPAQPPITLRPMGLVRRFLIRMGF